MKAFVRKWWWLSILVVLAIAVFGLMANVVSHRSDVPPMYGVVTHKTSVKEGYEYYVQTEAGYAIVSSALSLNVGDRVNVVFKGDGMVSVYLE